MITALELTDVLTVVLCPTVKLSVPDVTAQEERYVEVAEPTWQVALL